MFKFRLVLLVLLAFPLVPVGGAVATAELIFTGKVVGVSDGDIITVLHDKTPVKIRLQGVDAPEAGCRHSCERR